MLRNLHRLANQIDLQAFVTAFKVNHDKQHYFKGESHNFWEIVFIIKGKAKITKGDEIFILKPGNMVAHPPMEFHAICAVDEPVTFIVISFLLTGDIINPLRDSIMQLTAQMQDSFLSIFNDICKTFIIKRKMFIRGNAGSVISENIIKLKFETFLLELLKSVCEAESLSTTSALEYKKVVRILQDNIHKNLSVPEIAELAFLSTSTIKRVFKLHTGGGVNEYFIRLKLIEATKLLESGMKASDVSDYLGFSSPSYFSRSFSRYLGTSPKNYKKDKLIYEIIPYTDIT